MPLLQTVIEDDCLPMEQFAVHLMPHLLTLANDRVPNVRVLLAKTLRQTLLEKGRWETAGRVQGRAGPEGRHSPAWAQECSGGGAQGIAMQGPSLVL